LDTSQIDLQRISTARGWHFGFNAQQHTQCCTRAPRTRQLSGVLSTHIFRRQCVAPEPPLVSARRVPQAVSLVDRHATQQGTLPMARCGLPIGVARWAGTGNKMRTVITS